MANTDLKSPFVYRLEVFTSFIATLGCSGFLLGGVGLLVGGFFTEGNTGAMIVGAVIGVLLSVPGAIVVAGNTSKFRTRRYG